MILYYELYIDVYFLINLVMDYLLLLLVRSILKCTATHLRMLLGGLTGAAGACGIVLLPASLLIGKLILTYGILPVCLVKIGLQLKGKKLMVKGIVLFYLVSFLTGGVYQWLYEHTSSKTGFRTFLFFSVASYALIQAGMGVYRHFMAKNGNIYPVVLFWKGKCCHTMGLLDTGNSLKDPVRNKPVCIIEYDALSELMTTDMCRQVEDMLKLRICETQEYEPDGNFYYIPYHAVGKTNGLLPGCSIDYLRIDLDGEARIVKKPVLGICAEQVSSQKRYQMILHPQLLEG